MRPAQKPVSVAGRSVPFLHEIAGNEGPQQRVMAPGDRTRAARRPSQVSIDERVWEAASTGGSGRVTRTEASRASLTSVLLPTTSDPGLDGLAFSTFVDGAVSVPVSPVDLLLVAFSRRVVGEASGRGVAVVQLPRARHRTALTLAICMHLLRLKEELVAGPVVLAALDVDMTDQLRALRMRNYGSISLGRDNPLSAQRLTRTGGLAPLIGSAPGLTNSSFIYLNTRVGTPPFRCNPPLVVIDGTSITNPVSRARMLGWAMEHSAAATIFVGDIGDEALVQTATTGGQAPLVLPVTHAEVTELVYDLSRQDPVPSPLSSMWMLWQKGVPPLTIHRAGDAEVNAAIARSFACLASRPDGAMPLQLDYPSKLLNTGTRLAASVRHYRAACALANRPGEGPGGLRRVLRGLNFNGPGRAWQAWGAARWGELKVAVEALWRQLDECNPKLSLLWEMLDRADRSGVSQILIRCHSKTAAIATRESLTGEDRTDTQIELWRRVGARVEVTTFATRYPPGHADIQILTGNPPPWHFSLLFTGEASATWLLAYDAEQAMLRRQLHRWQSSIDALRRTTFRALGATDPAPVIGPILFTQTGSVPNDPPELRLPNLSILDVLNRATAAIDSPLIIGAGPSDWHASGITRSCVPIKLDDGRTWWVRNDEAGLATPILVHTAAGQRYLPLREISPGDVVIAPAGDGNDSVHARLVAVSHTNDEVKSLDAILEQFRGAARKVLNSHATQQDAIEAVRAAGAQAPGQLSFWASGRTIAPRSPGDIAAVFRAAEQPTADLRLLNSVAGTLRTLHRDLGDFVTALASGRTDHAVERIRRLIGDRADELLDEFVAVTVIEVGSPIHVPANLAGRLR
ncbi:Uncharacterised protein [Mycobacteroides abscessus subsp. bolletii]|uniref:DISARM protein DrmE C-terminal domain-containing protein n=1 Tax=Mycobacteroides abscessus subsp. bolletii TaxID=319705 RepID=A0A9Q7SCV3_9MYCO|nr:Uncharacterised protein [Mycobacteroides abscessus subsp. bolletii]SHV21973.1 Uncharacterised protein [Mycobacteroides abscessus subsp. bolletii]SHX21071.1 Uncharacterised protein [Mycobacteroides abscessus subsp. bolletii]SKL38009.1 Uncharacterised protein [Mycobacteroides abscessus subsp. bolletii]SKM62848.1 Uncharacterised protein [Mycobacteroides abscessus subsp. bolletii]